MTVLVLALLLMAVCGGALMVHARAMAAPAPALVPAPVIPPAVLDSLGLDLSEDELDGILRPQLEAMVKLGFELGYTYARTGHIGQVGYFGQPAGDVRSAAV